MGAVTNSTDKYQKCINMCNQCAQACCECFKACLNEPDIAARKNCIAMLVECSDFCRMASKLMAGSSAHVKEFCALCANICDECAKDCGNFSDDHCVKCAEICTNCAAECREM